LYRTVAIAFLCTVAVAGCSRSNSSEGRRSPQGLLGKPAPYFELTDLKGGKFSLAEGRGKPVFIDFWATWCPPCRISTPAVKQLHDEFESRGVEMIPISVDDRADKVELYTSQNGITYRQFMAGTSGVDQAYGVRGIPMFVTIDKQGNVSRIWNGFSPDMPGEWRAELERLLKA
jgi:thiol-disulfide isomerase/thioredoxin